MQRVQDDLHDIHDASGLTEMSLVEHHFRENLNPPATKANLKNSLEGAAWAHMALHGNLQTDSLVYSS